MRFKGLGYVGRFKVTVNAWLEVDQRSKCEVSEFEPVYSDECCHWNGFYFYLTVKFQIAEFSMGTCHFSHFHDSHIELL